MVTVAFIILCVVSVVVGAVIGLFIGWVLWQLGFEIIGGAVALVGAGVGGIILLLAALAWGDRILTRMESKS
jgi:hypothetical protein